MSDEDSGFDETCVPKGSPQSIVLLNLQGDYKTFDDQELGVCQGDTDITLSNGAVKFTVPHLETKSVVLPKARGKNPRDVKQAQHHFIHTGDGAIVSMAVSDFYDSSRRLMAVAKSPTGSVIRGLTGFFLQIWSLDMRNPGDAALLQVYTASSQFITHARWAHVERDNKAARTNHILATVDSSGTLQMREFRVSRNGKISQRLLLSASSKYTCVDVSRQDDMIHLLAGTTEGMVIINQYRFDGKKAHLHGASCASVAKAPLSAVAWLPGTKNTFYAIGTSVGQFVIGDRRFPTNPRLLSADYASRPIVQISPGDIVGNVVGAHVTGFIYSTLYVESSHHHPLKNFGEIKRSNQPLTETRWLKAMFPDHRRPLVLKAFEQPATACASVLTDSLWTYDDGSVLTGFIPELDRKSYKSAGVIQWSLIEPVEDPFVQDEPVADTADIIEHTTQSIDRCVELGLRNARQAGVLVTLSSYYTMVAAYKQYVRCLPAETALDSVMASAYILRLSAATEFRGSDAAYFAYGGSLGIIHIFPSGIFET